MNNCTKILAIGSFALILTTTGGFSAVRAQQQPSVAPSQPPSEQHQISETMLQEYVTDQNKELPTVIQKTIRWDSIALGTGRTLIYNYTFLDPAIQQINPEEAKGIKNSIVKTVCDSDPVRLLLDDAVNFNFKYRANQGKVLTEVSIDRNDCQG